MKKIFFLSLLLFQLECAPPIDLQKISEKIWKNECGGTLDGLTHWNQGEDFGSFGIGHFIWYPQNKQGPFEETFPSLLAFLQREGVDLPAWLKTAKGCPWISRKLFYKEISSPKMVALRQLLLETRHLQAQFIANRLEKKLLETHPKNLHIFNQLTKDPKGLYALIDYLNFKGAGTSASERYENQGWGLLQVLEGIPPNSATPLPDFVKSAKKVLMQRVENAPPERDEQRWLKGWLNRVESYLAD